MSFNSKIKIQFKFALNYIKSNYKFYLNKLFEIILKKKLKISLKYLIINFINNNI